MHLIESYRGIAGVAMEDISLFRCAKNHMLAELFIEAGFKKVSQKSLGGKVKYPSKEHYWQFITQVTAPVALAIAQLEESCQQEVKARLFEYIGEMAKAGKVVFDYESLILTAEK